MAPTSGGARPDEAVRLGIDHAIDPLVDALGRLERSSRRLRSEFCSALGISGSEFSALLSMGRTEVVTPTELANALGITTGATTALIDRLTSAGLVDRRRSTRDRRSVLLSLTVRGVDQVAWVSSEYRDMVEGAVRHDPELFDAKTARLVLAVSEVSDELAARLVAPAVVAARLE